MIVRDVVKYYGIPYGHAWHEMPARDLLLYYEGIPEYERQRQAPSALLTMVVARALGSKTATMEDFFTGWAVVGLEGDGREESATYSKLLVRDVEIASVLGLLSNNAYVVLNGNRGALKKSGAFWGKEWKAA